MQKRTLVIVVAILGFLTLLASGRFRQFGMFDGESGEFAPSMGMYGADTAEKFAVDSGVAVDRMIAPYPGGMGGDALGDIDRAIEYSSSHQLVVTDVQVYMQEIRAYVQGIGGQVLYWHQGKEPLQLYRYGTLTAKVPVPSFESALQKITEGVEDIISENQNMADITGQKVYSTDELERIKGEVSVQEAALSEATTESAKVRIQNQLTQLRRQLADAERAVDQVTERTEYATISISVADSERYFGGRHQPSPREDFSEALRSVWISIGTIVRTVVWVSVYAVIWLPVVAVLSWLYSTLGNKSNK